MTGEDRDKPVVNGTAMSSKPSRPISAGDLGLYAATVLIWSTTWIALKFQVGTIDAQVSLLWRFALASPILFAICWATRNRLRFPASTHLKFLGIGVLMFSTNFNLYYHAAEYVVSGLLAVIFSTASIINIALAAIFLGERIRAHVAAGAALGLLGVGLMFWPEISGSLGTHALTGLGLGVCGSLSFCLGNMVSAHTQRKGVSVLSMNAWGSFYGACINFLLALVAGSVFAVEPTTRYLLALLWLAVPGTVVAFWAYLALLGRIGADRAAYTTVLAPVLALLISTAVEGYRLTLLGALGLTLVALGNILVLRRSA